MDSAAIEHAIAEIAMSGDYARRLDPSQHGSEAGVARALNRLLAEVEKRDTALLARLDQLADARDDAQTSNLLLRRVREDLRARTIELDGAVTKAAAASSAKSQFLANMSHEIRTPMNGILGMAELLRRGALEDKQRQQVNTIVHSGRALLQIINDILDFSKIESGKFDLDPKTFDLRMCLGDIVELLRPGAAAKALDLNLVIDPLLPNVFIGDAGRIRQIAMNLTGNAVKFTEKGSVTVKLSGGVEGDRYALLIEISDTGVGIPADKLADVFEKFSQIDNTGARRHEGTGLGLSISQVLARRMDGDITVTSELGKGSTFSFRLKLPAHAVAPREIAPGANLANKSVALVGEFADADVAAATLRRAGASVVAWPLRGARTHEAAAANPAEAIVLFDSAASDGLIDAIAAIRGSSDESRAAILVCVANGAPGDARRVADAGGGGYLSGAFDASLLVRALERVLHSDATETGLLVTRHSLAEGAVYDRTPPTPKPLCEDRRFSALVVDDSLVNQEVAKEFLEELRCDVEVANNGEEAVAVTGARRFDVVLMDCQMPIMDGFAATAAIRARHGAATPANVPIVALTANAFASDRDKCLASGMSDFLSKPFMPADFERAITHWLHARAPHATTAIASHGANANEPFNPIYTVAC